MIYKAAKKIPGGKLVRVKVQAGEVIESVQISGDFFLHPEEALPNIERALLGLSRDSATSDFAAAIHRALMKEKAAFIGVTPEDIAATLQEAFTKQE